MHGEGKAANMCMSTPSEQTKCSDLAPTFHSQAHSPLPNSSATSISLYKVVSQSFTPATAPTRESIDIYHEESNKTNGPAQTGPATSKIYFS
jgi:hypothetical protein